MLIQFARLGVFAAVLLGSCVVAAVGTRRLLQGTAMTRRGKAGFASALAFLAATLGCYLYGTLVEADSLEVTRTVISTPRLPRGAHYRIAHISDLHVDVETPSLRQLRAAMQSAGADVLAFTGDAVNTNAGVEVFRSLLAGLPAPLGRFGVRGNHDAWYWKKVDLFGGVATELNTQHPVFLDGGKLAVCGSRYGKTWMLPQCLAEARQSGAFTLLLNHTPDVFEELAPRADLTLVGHTHGGQVRAPLYGALITMARSDKKYEMGRYDFPDGVLYVHRGIGFEPQAPRVRFLAPPELTLIDVEGTGEPNAGDSAKSTLGEPPPN